MEKEASPRLVDLHSVRTLDNENIGAEIRHLSGHQVTVFLPREIARI